LLHGYCFISRALTLPSRRTQARHLAHPSPPLRPRFRPDRLAATHYAAKTAEAPRAASADPVFPPAAGAAARLARLPLGGRNPLPPPAAPDRQRTSASQVVQAAAASARSGLDRACAPAAATWTEEFLKSQCASIFRMQGYYYREYFRESVRRAPTAAILEEPALQRGGAHAPGDSSFLLRGRAGDRQKSPNLRCAWACICLRVRVRGQ
jgi:hypothetical protein